MKKLKNYIKSSPYLYKSTMVALRVKNICINPLRLSRFLREKINPKEHHPNSMARQLRWCSDAVDAYQKGHQSWESSKFSISIDKELNLGDYTYIRDQIVIPYARNKICLEIGCLDGKWSIPLCKHARQAYLCDLDKIIEPILDQRLLDAGVNKDKYQFKVINGRDLRDFEDKSIDFIFSIDSLVRAPKEAILNYIHEVCRLLSVDSCSRAYLHLPLSECQLSNLKRFTKVSYYDYITCLDKECVTYRFTKIVNHGIFLMITPDFTTPST